MPERENHIGAGPYQRGVERNGYVNGFKLRTFQTAIGTVRDCATLKAIGIRHDDGKRIILGVSCARSEVEVHWREKQSKLAA